LLNAHRVEPLPALRKHYRHRISAAQRRAQLLDHYLFQARSFKRGSERRVDEGIKICARAMNANVRDITASNSDASSSVDLSPVLTRDRVFRDQPSTRSQRIDHSDGERRVAATP
jgi:hypothetical protein